MEDNHNYSHQGYKTLPFFKQAEIIHDFTMEFCEKYINPRSRTKDQMEQAARSGKQNISEGYAQNDWRGKDKLLRISRGSFEELLQDYLDFLRQRNSFIWEKDDPEAKKVRNLVYKIKDYNDYKDYNGYKNYEPGRPYDLYRPYLQDPERAANAMVCLINQTNMMLNQKIRWVETDMPKTDSLSLRGKWLHQQAEKERRKNEEFDQGLKEKLEKIKKENL